VGRVDEIGFEQAVAVAVGSEWRQKGEVTTADFA